MRNKRKTLTADELAAVERTVDIPPLGEHHTITIRHERSRLADAIRQLPGSSQAVLAIAALLIVVLIFVSAVMTLSAFLPGGPPSLRSCAATRTDG